MCHKYPVRKSAHLWWEHPLTQDKNGDTHVFLHIQRHTQFTLSGRVFVVLYDSCQSKISYFTEQTLWHQDISCSQVSVNIILLLYVRHALCYLQQHKKGIVYKNGSKLQNWRKTDEEKWIHNALKHYKHHDTTEPTLYHMQNSFMFMYVFKQTQDCEWITSVTDVIDWFRCKQAKKSRPNMNWTSISQTTTYSFKVLKQLVAGGGLLVTASHMLIGLPFSV